jgi:hypothetical protein
MTTQVRSTRTTSNGNYNANQLNAQMAGVHLNPNGNDHFRMPQPWGNYQPPSVSPYPDDDDYSVSHQGSFGSRPSTNASQQSFGMQPSLEQTQGSPPPPKDLQSAPSLRNEGEIQHLNETDRFPTLIPQCNASHNFPKVGSLPLIFTIPNRQASHLIGPCHLNLAQVTFKIGRTHLISILRTRRIP